MKFAAIDKGFRTLFILLFLVIIVFQNVLSQDIADTVSHQIEVCHPGLKADDSTMFDLLEFRDEDNLPVEYLMVVQSVFCAEEKCKVVPVQLFWNEIGEYKSYRLEEGVLLEKDEGKPFVAGDHKQLHEILMDQNSPFKSLSYDEIITVNLSNQELDAISGATSISLSENQTVKGATWTCYTLWHWANSGVKDSIKQITGNVCEENQLIIYLNKLNASYQEFALSQLLRRKLYSPESIKSLLQILARKDAEFEGLAMEYLDHAPRKLYFKSMNQLISLNKNGQRILALNSLLRTPYGLPIGFLDELSQELTEFINYQEVDLFLQILEEKKGFTQLTIKNIMLLLERNILIARRAYWFLLEADLTASQRVRLNKFREMNSEFLY